MTVELTADPWAHVPGSAPHIAQVRAVFAPRSLSSHDRRKDGRRGWWVPVSCRVRDEAVDAAGGLAALATYASDGAGFTEWGARVGGLPVVADVVTGDACHHLRYVIEP